MTKANTGSFGAGQKAASETPKTWAQTQRDAAALDQIRKVVLDYLEPSNMDPDRDFNALNEIIRIIETKTGYQFLDIAPAPSDGGPLAG